MNPKKIIIIAGPNGAGKTTFAKAFLPNEANCTAFINADLIAAGIAPFAPESAAIAAGRIMLELIKKHVVSGTSFAFATTLSGVGYARMIPKWQVLGYFVQLYLVSLSSSDLAVERVAHRVKHGGHHIPDEVVRRRYAAGLKNFHEVYKPLMNKWTLFDNDGIDTNAVDWGQSMDSKVLRKQKTSEVLGAEAAMARAAQAARTTAKQFNIPIVVQQNGQIVKLSVQ